MTLEKTGIPRANSDTTELIKEVKRIMSESQFNQSYQGAGRDRNHGLPALSRVWHWQRVKLSDVSLGVRPRYSLVVDEDVKKPNKQTYQGVNADQRRGACV